MSAREGADPARVRELEERVRQLEADLGAGQRVIDTLIRRSELHFAQETGTDRFAVLKTLSSLENLVQQRTRELYESEARYRALFDHAPDMLLLVDAAQRVSAANQTAIRTLGVTGDQVVGKPLAALFDPAARPQVDAWCASSWTSGVAELALRDGRTVACDASRVPGFDGLFQVVLRDVTARRRLEVELQQAQRLAAVGHLAAGVAHEINNPLTVLQMRLEMLEQQDLGPLALRQIRILRDHAMRIARIVRNLQSFARPRTGEREAFRFADAVRAAQELALRQLGRAEVVLDMPPDLAVAADRGGVEQVLANLLGNAGDAMKGRGCVVVRASRDGNRVQVAVEDEGTGIAADLLGDVFTPFVTRKSGGTGLGLAIAWSLVNDHGGTLRAENRAEGGARLLFSLPAADHAVLRSNTTEIPVGESDRRMRVLVVDDEPALLQSIRHFVAGAGHEVDGVASAEEALAALTERQYDAVLTDVRLPGMTGDQLLAAIRERDPALADRTVLISGLFLDPPANVRYLQKPFGRRQLLALLDELADT